MDLEFVDKHDWICNIEYLKKLINNNVDIVFVLGMATNQDNFLYLFNKIILLECSPEIFCKRIKDRTDNNFGKNKEVQQRILENYKSYRDKMLKQGAILIDTDKLVTEVVDEVIKHTILID